MRGVGKEEGEGSERGGEGGGGGKSRGGGGDSRILCHNSTNSRHCTYDICCVLQRNVRILRTTRR